MKKISAMLVLLLAVQVTGRTQELPKVFLPGSEIQKITSHIINGQEYELDISLPSGYGNSTKKYPVVFLMDAQWDFPLLKSIYGQQYFDGFIPEMIIIGVTWGGTNPNPDSLRARDYTPTTEKRLPQSGGAENFISFIKKELFPFAESTYRIDTTDRTLVGCSLGGLFTMYTLFTHPAMFKNYVAACPAYGWDKEVIYQYEKKYFDNNPNLPARLYMTIGDVEKGVPGFEKLTKYLLGRHYRNVQIKSKILENTGHSGTKTEGFSRGLQYAFERPSLHPEGATLNRYTGQYDGEDGTDVEIKFENYGLTAYLAGGNKYALFAASEKDYYATSEFFKIQFSTDTSGNVEGLKLERYGKSGFFKKNKLVPPDNSKFIIIVK